MTTIEHMTTMPMTAPTTTPTPHRAQRALLARLVAAGVVTLVLAGCSDEASDKPATQTAAKVNKEEITVHQINFVLQQQRRAVPEDRAASASQVVLERLIDQELAVQKAQEQKLDRDPRVMQQLEAARRDIIARNYVERIAAGAPKPSPDEVKAYYSEHPALFAQRRIYTLQEIKIEAKPEQLDELRTKLAAAKNVNEFVNFLRGAGYQFAADQAVRAAEQLPIATLPTFAKMEDGQALINPTPSGATVLVLAASRSQPLAEDAARPYIEQFLLNERRRKVVADDLKALRSTAEISYVGAFAADRPASAPSLLEVTERKSPLIAAPASAPEIVPIRPAASAPAGSVLDRGLQGLK